MKIALAQINPILGAFSHNAEKIRDKIEEGKKRGADLIVFSELVLSGYPPQDFLNRRSFLTRNHSALTEISSDCEIGCLLGTVEKKGEKLYNSIAFLHRGEVTFVHRKILLPNYDVFDEKRYFAEGGQPRLFSYGGEEIGLLLCEDAWYGSEYVPTHTYDRNPLEELAPQKPSVVIQVSASPYVRGKLEARVNLMAGIARDLAVPVLTINQVGGQDEILFDGHSFALDGKGELKARARGFEEDLILFDTLSKEGEIREVEDQEEEVLQALIMGARDYTRKCGFHRVTLGISGGIDSAVTAYIAREAVGRENVLGVLMPSRFSSPGSVKDGKDLCEKLEIEHKVISIEPAYDTYLDMLQPLFEDRPFGLTEENLQARIRGQLLMAISNKLGHLVYATGNKSELAVGYCTLYGDMIGGLAVLSDVPKTLVYKLARHINAKKELIPENSITKAPSAELRPDQKDTDSLPPYEILDQILERYIEKYQDVEEIVSAGFDRQIVEEVIRKVEGNEYKRKMAAMGLKITSQAFGLGRRMPVAERFHEERIQSKNSQFFP